jgi:hypothetical protein
MIAAARLEVSSQYQLIDVLVFGADVKIDTTPYEPDVQAQIEQHLRRFEAYKSKRVRPTGSSELAMVYGARVRYERRLVAVSNALEADALALAYVTDLAPCYEWEGFHDCPEHEAVFAARHQAAHPTGPFSQYLPLLEAHRWLCAAEGYDREKSPAEAARTRRSYAQALSVARRSESLLVRTAAVELGSRARCHAER